MRVPNYYCPHCNRFKKWYQVSSNPGYFFYCKHCGSKIYDTEAILLDFVQNYLQGQGDNNEDN